ncbi:MAG: hypothetical protein HYR63_24215 [Proteobacteria bacterium]|nr:hypothetical protein [Pseudomonadota bacterium]MBI3496408.1 hypothetical protein [Pseudomonadota bacterium]
MRHLSPLLVLLVLLLAACSSSSKKEAPTACPRVAVLQDLSRLTEFREGTGRDVTDRRYEFAFAGLAASCTYDKTGVTIEITVQIQAFQGLADRDGKARVQYFAAVLDPDGQVLQKEAFDTEAEFKGKQARVLLSEDLRQRIPLSERLKGPGYSVLFGFQLTEAQLQYQHRTQGR